MRRKYLFIGINNSTPAHSWVKPVEPGINAANTENARGILLRTRKDGIWSINDLDSLIVEYYRSPTVTKVQHGSLHEFFFNCSTFLVKTESKGIKVRTGKEVLEV